MQVSESFVVLTSCAAARPACVRRDRRVACDGSLLDGGEGVCAREDVGQHNALDKVLGWAFARAFSALPTRVLCVSGRLSFELVQKASVAGCPIMVADGAPSSLAVEVVRDRGMTLCGFVRDGRADGVLARPWRILS